MRSLPRSVDKADSGMHKRFRHRGTLDSKIAHRRPNFEFFSSLLATKSMASPNRSATGPASGLLRRSIKR